jgi:hypothetical protein
MLIVLPPEVRPEHRSVSFRTNLMGCTVGNLRPCSAGCGSDDEGARKRCQQLRGQVDNSPIGPVELSS